MNSRWGIYLKERFPLLPNVIAAWGMILSCAHLALGPYATIPPVKFAFGLTGGLVFLAQLRFMDELKDYEKDKIAHPERPLPRGLFTPAEFANWVKLFQRIMIGLSVLAAFVINPLAGILFGFGTGYLYLMYHEFFIGPRLANSPLLYAITHQLITVPMLGFAVAVFAPAAIVTESFGWFSLFLVCAFFVFEIGRKLDPEAHPLLTTYLVVYGRTRTVVFMVILTLLLMLSAYRLGMGKVFFPLGILSLLSFSIVFVAPRRFKWVEGILMVLLLASLWTLPFLGLR